MYSWGVTGGVLLKTTPTRTRVSRKAVWLNRVSRRPVWLKRVSRRPLWLNRVSRRPLWLKRVSKIVKLFQSLQLCTQQFLVIFKRDTFFFPRK